MSYTYKRPVWGDWLVTEDGVFFAFTEAALLAYLKEPDHAQ